MDEEEFRCRRRRKIRKEKSDNFRRRKRGGRRSAAYEESLNLPKIRQFEEKEEDSGREIFWISVATKVNKRYEATGKWRPRMRMAGFMSCPLSAYVNGAIKSVLKSYCDRYKINEEGGALYFGWEGKILVVASAWK